MSFAGGFEYNFIHNDEELICPICTLVARDPHQANCCGSLYCENCLLQLKDIRSNFTCPNCRAKLDNNYFFDQRANRKVRFLQVFCNNKDNGCQWKGDLKDIEDHLQECPYELLSCSNNCGMYLQRRHLQNHLYDCPKQLIKCQYCDEDVSIDIITQDHLGVCSGYPIRCTNEGCSKKVPRRQMQSHKRSCPKEIISCGYMSVGCGEVMKRDELEEHNIQWREQHLQLAVDEVKTTKEKLQVTENVVKLLSRHQTLNINNVFKLSDFADKKRNGTSWISPGFYTSPGGYKFCLQVDADGFHYNGEGGHVSCGIYLMSGVYDDLLEWPFCGYISIEILNQLEDDHHFRRVFRYNRSHHYGNRVIGCERAETGRGKNEFISYSQLHIDSSINCQYLKDDTLYFRVRIEVPSNTKPWLIT